MTSIFRCYPTLHSLTRIALSYPHTSLTKWQQWWHHYEMSKKNSRDWSQPSISLEKRSIKAECNTYLNTITCGVEELANLLVTIWIIFCSLWLSEVLCKRPVLDWPWSKEFTAINTGPKFVCKEKQSYYIRSPFSLPLQVPTPKSDSSPRSLFDYLMCTCTFSITLFPLPLFAPKKEHLFTGYTKKRGGGDNQATKVSIDEAHLSDTWPLSDTWVRFQRPKHEAKLKFPEGWEGGLTLALPTPCKQKFFHRRT